MSFLDQFIKVNDAVQKAAGPAALTAAGVPAPLAKIAGKVNPQTVFYKGISKAQNWLNKVVGKKKSKAERRLAEEQQRIAQLEALQTGGTRSGTDYPTSPLQKAVFGAAPDESKKLFGPTVPVPSALLEKIDSKNKNGKQMEQVKDWFGKNWMYVVGGLAAYYLFMGKKRR